MKVAALAPAAVLSWSSNWGPLKRGLQGAEEMIPSGGGESGYSGSEERKLSRWREQLAQGQSGGKLQGPQRWW